MNTLKTRLLIILLISFLPAISLANSAPVVSNVSASQRSDDSKLVDIYYDLADADGDLCAIWPAISDDGGSTWRVPADSYTGAVGHDVSPGTHKHIIWDAGKDMPGKNTSFKVRIFADDGNGQESVVLVSAGWFAYQNAVPGNYIYLDSFMIDKYETTVSQYCQFLNSADPAGDHWASGQEITRQGDPGNYYYEIQTGRENYPVRYVSYYDANAYAAWKSSQTGLTYRLPTEQEWEKAAGWDPVIGHLYTYGCHRDILYGYTFDWICHINYYNGPLPVGSFNGTGGKNDAKSFYGCYDMSGNLSEWCYSCPHVRGGSCYSSFSECVVTYPSNASYVLAYGFQNIGFRLVLELD